MIDANDLTVYLPEYIKEVAELSGMDLYQVERIINTQLAMTVGNLALKGKSEHYLGKLTFNKRTFGIDIEPSTLVTDICKGTLDPRFVLKEIIENA